MSCPSKQEFPFATKLKNKMKEKNCNKCKTKQNNNKKKSKRITASMNEWDE